MSLILPPWYFNYCTDNQPNTPSLPAPGVACTPGINNTEGTPVTLLSALTHDVHRLVIHVANTATASSARYTHLDILRDPAGGTSWASFIDDLCCGFISPNAATANSGAYFDFPIFIPAGTSLGARIQTPLGTAPTATRITVFAFGEPSRPDMWWCGQGVETLGIAALTRGTTVTPGNSSAWGSWTSVGSTTTHRYGAIQLGTGGTDNVATAVNYQFQVGVGSQVLPGFPVEARNMSTNEAGVWMKACGPVWCDIPAGSQMQVRGKSNGTAEIWDVALYGVY